MGAAGRTSQPYFTISMTGSASQVVRITGFSMPLSSSAFGNDGAIKVNGNTAGQQLRIDHCNFSTPANQSAFVFVYGVYGVADHNIFNAGGTLTNAISVNSGGDGSIPWNTATPRGTANNFFIENNTFLNGYADDCKKVAALSRATTSSSPRLRTAPLGRVTRPAAITWQGDNPQPQGRGCRAWEMYGNYANSSYSGGSSIASFNTSGTGLQWGNTVINYNNDADLVSDRESNATYPETPTPTGWGSAGTTSMAPGADGMATRPLRPAIPALTRSGAASGIC